MSHETLSTSSSCEDDHSGGGDDHSKGGSTFDVASMGTNPYQPSKDGGDDDDLDLHSTIGRKEANRVRWSKILVFCVLSIATGIMAYFTNEVMSRDEEKAFETEFSNFGMEIFEASVITAQNIFATIESMSHGITSFTLATNATWPFVTIPHYSFRGFHLLELSGSKYLGFCPFVPVDDRQEWEEYSTNNAGWINDPIPDSLFNPSFKPEVTITKGPVEGDDSTASNETDTQSGHWGGNSTLTSTSIPPFIHRVPDGSSLVESMRLPPVKEDQDYDGDHYVVGWQTTPPTVPMINLNFLSIGDDFTRVYDQLRRSRSPVLSEMIIYSNAPIPYPSAWPSSYLLQPIFPSFDQNASMVGMFLASVPWHKYFEKIVPAGAGAIDLVIKSTCDQTISYRITGPDVVHSGNGDHHDSQFDHLELMTQFSVVQKASAAGVCHYMIHLYPTKDFESDFITSTPLAYTVGVVLVFMLTSAVFLLYDCFVEQRQKKVMHSAARTNALLTSLFPAQFRDRLIEDHDAALQDAREIDMEGMEPSASMSTPAHGTGLLARSRAAFRGKPRGRGGLLPTLGATTSSSRNLKKLNSFADYEAEKARLLLSEPIADLFPSVTVLFADIAGFTAWASVREPSQVFTLLEQIYSTFDAIAKRRGIFKVETIGDCYVAACGLPNPRDDHAVAMLRFARECLHQMTHCAQSLEVLLGPDTGDLTMRFGIHSGPVTAGVLRGEKTRFQLFGDTVNMAARMESTGLENRIHLSASTVKLLAAADKSHWAVARDDLVEIKGKGKVQTYWASGRSHGRGRRGSHGSVELAMSAINVADAAISVDSKHPLSQQTSTRFKGTSQRNSGCAVATTTSISMAGTITTQARSMSTLSTITGAPPPPPLLSTPSSTSPVIQHRTVDSKRAQQEKKMKRLVEWNADVLQGLLQKVVAMRDPRPTSAKRSRPNMASNEFSLSSFSAITPEEGKFNQTVLDEVKEIIELPDRASKYKCDPATVKLDPAVISELREYVTAISQMYRHNSFHCFEHASHVVQSVTKLLSRVVTPDKRIDRVNSGKDNATSNNGESEEWTYQQQDMNKGNNRNSGRTKQLHEYTYGITSDPLTQFACVFSALIHDVDHCGVPNTVLVKECMDVALHYKNKSVAEQNSVDLAWELLGHDNFANLRRCICATQSELERFRQLVVNSVMATDIADKDLGALRKARWERAFAEQDDGESDCNRPKSLADSSDGVSISDAAHSSGPNAKQQCSKHERRLSRLMAQNRKATIVIEHLIQASDVSHTMQHWHVYLKWNERLFHEMYAAYLAGRFGEDGANPAEGWYAGELSFFDFYLIPLAKKLSTCGVFGVASDEYLNYATANRQEWERKGKDVVQRYMSKYQMQQGSQPSKK